MSRVFIGVGHGGSDPGAVVNGIKESHANLDVAKACAEVLEAHGVEVMLSRTSDVTEDLTDRIRECNAFKPDLAADIHHNAGGGDGAEVYHIHNNPYDDALAKNILDEIVKIGQNSRGLKTKLNSDGTTYFGFLRQVDCPSVLVECAFLDNKNDVKIVDTLEERKAMGVAIAKGFLKTLGIEYNATPAKNVFYRVQTGAFGNKDYAVALYNKIKALGFEVCLVKVDGLYKVQCGAFKNENNAENLAAKLKKAGFDSFITTRGGEAVSVTSKKSIDTIAKEILLGEWGNGAKRKALLAEAGYIESEIEAIQKRVNELL